MRKHYEIQEKDLLEVFKFWDSLQNLSIVTLVGGEPFLYEKYYKKIYEYTHKRGIELHFITNGLGIREDSIWNDFIKENQDVYIQISYDGTKDTRGKDFFEDTAYKERCKYLAEQGRLNICTVVTKYSWNIVDIYANIYEYLGDVSLNWIILPLLETKSCVELNKETPAELYLTAMYHFMAMYHDFNLPKNVLLKYICSMKYHNHKEEFFTEADGTIVRSCFDFTPIGNWKTDNLTSIYNKSNYLSLNSTSDKCVNCPINELCIKRPEFFSEKSCSMRVGLEEVIFTLMREANCQNLEDFEDKIRLG